MNAIARVRPGPRLQVGSSTEGELQRSEVRELAERIFGAVGSGKQMAHAMGVTYASYRWAMSAAVPLPLHWEGRIRRLQRQHRGTIHRQVRAVLLGASAGSQGVVDFLAPAIHAWADQAEGEGIQPRDVATALLTVGALRLVRSP